MSAPTVQKLTPLLPLVSYYVHVEMLSMSMIYVGEGHFGMYSIGESVTLNCADTTGSAELVQWVTETRTTSGASSVSLVISSITDQHHRAQYTCRIQFPELVQDLTYTIIVLGKLRT